MGELERVMTEGFFCLVSMIALTAVLTPASTVAASSAAVAAGAARVRSSGRFSPGAPAGRTKVITQIR